MRECFICGMRFPDEELERYDTVRFLDDGTQKVIKSRYLCEECGVSIGWKK